MKISKKENLYERLPAFIRHKKQGFDYSLVMRDGRIAWYEARYLKGSELVSYIVIKIRMKKATRFPSPSEYGKMGWFHMPKSRSASKAHFMELVEDDKEEMREAA